MWWFKNLCNDKNKKMQNFLEICYNWLLVLATVTSCLMPKKGALSKCIKTKDWKKD